MKARFKTQYLEKNEQSITYIVKELNGDRCMISPLVWDGIAPIENTKTEYLEFYN